MFRINYFYWVLIPLCIYLLYELNLSLSLTSNNFYGFAENKQTEINLDNDVVVNQIVVKSGDKIKKGQLLMKVFNPRVMEEINQLNTSMEGIKIKDNLNDKEIKAEILALDKEKNNKIAALQTELKILKEEADFYLQLVDNSQKVNSDSTIASSNPLNAKISSLKEEIENIKNGYSSLMNHYSNLLKDPKESRTLYKQWENKKTAVMEQISKFDILAPYDGVVGSVNVKEGEHIKAFSSLISYYEASPPMVLAYVPEKYNVILNIGDDVLINSVYNPNKKVTGLITSKGNRIVEIPEKFRKIPDVKIYGIEIFITIPHNNLFLQKEMLSISLNK